MDTQTLEQMVRRILLEKLGDAPAAHGVRLARPAGVSLTEAHRLDTGVAGARAYTRDLFTLEESPRLGVGVMEIQGAAFPWTLSYDEMDYVLEGRLDILIGGEKVSAGPGELILIPKGSSIHFSTPEHARFLYFVYPADWQK